MTDSEIEKMRIKLWIDVYVASASIQNSIAASPTYNADSAVSDFDARFGSRTKRIDSNDKPL